jgi:hypothetical protein
MMTLSKILTQDPQILGATVQNLVATATWRPEFMHPPLGTTSTPGWSVWSGTDRSQNYKGRLYKIPFTTNPQYTHTQSAFTAKLNIICGLCSLNRGYTNPGRLNFVR